MPSKTALLLTNLGTPDSLDRNAVKRFLREFLSDPLVVRLPRLLWLPLLYGIILPLRSGKTLQAYSRVWGEQGSPLLAIARQQQLGLQSLLGERCQVLLAMRYGNPDFATQLKSLQLDGVEKLVVLPLYPQYSVTTTATTYKHLKSLMNQSGYTPELEFIGYYHDHPAYIEALAGSVRQHWRERQRHLLMSFHGLPQENIDRGDPYQQQCEKSAKLLAAQLGLDDDQWSIGYQSRFGKQTWIQPYTADVLQGLVQRGITDVDVVCPGFSADCLETLDEIEVEYREEYIRMGGKEFSYIPALNDQPAHLEMMRTLVDAHLPANSAEDSL